MSVAGGPNIVTSGLLVCVDAANSKSYPGSGNTWIDLTGKGYTATINNAQTFSTTFGGGILTPANQITTFVSMPIQPLQALSNGTIWTMEWTLTLLSGTAGIRYGPHMTIAGGNEFIWVYESGLNVQYLFGYTILVSGANPLFEINVPMMMTLTKNGTTYRIYKNGVFAAEYVGNAFDAKAIQSWVLDQEQDGIGTNFDPNQNTNANWHNVKLYDRILTNEEILQNFNASRGRYGL
jgi:hypothetical protein